ncbi:MAG TPA: intradiol ring-cleavage dioxygenase [Longimicrobium sp.]|nr:intradiol ring-cleavage dioxygenase [Longimicrobium sp.]
MDDDDLPIGRILNRREALKLFTAAGAAVLSGCGNGGSRTAASSGAGSAASGTGTGAAATAVPGCVVRPELTVGPYFVDQQLERSDIRPEPTTGAAKAGVPLALTFNVSQIGSGACTPLPGAMVDVWQCDADGVYSGVQDQLVGFDTTGQKFLRGWQRTGADGTARFTTIYPGWYPGRTVHIHFKIRRDASASQAYEFTSQLFFDDALTDQVHARPPYAAKGERDLRNARDGIYQEAGDQLLLALTPAGAGYQAAFAIALDLSDAEVGGEDRMGRPGGPGGRPPGPPPRRP